MSSNDLAARMEKAAADVLARGGTEEQAVAAARQVGASYSDLDLVSAKLSILIDQYRPRR